MVLALCSRVGLIHAQDQIGEPVPIYPEAELIHFIEQRTPLETVNGDGAQLVEDIVNQLDCRHRITLTDDNDNARVVLTPRKKDKKFRIIRSFITNE